MKISEHANYLLNEFGRLQFDYAAYCKPNGESLRNEARNNLETYIAELEAERHWIPVSERLPEANTPVLTISKDNNEPVTAWLEDDFWWSSVDWSLSVTHWMPIPKLPEVQE